MIQDCNSPGSGEQSMPNVQAAGAAVRTNPESIQDGGSSGSVTNCIKKFQTGESKVANAAFTELWNRYFEKLIPMIRKHLGRSAVYDHEDVAQSVFHKLSQGMRKGSFPKLHDRDDLWMILVYLARCNIIDRRRKHKAQKNSNHETLREAELYGPASDAGESGNPLESLPGDEPDPALAVELAEEFRGFLDFLKGKNPTAHRVLELKLDGYTNPDEIAKKLDLLLPKERKHSTSMVRREITYIHKAWLEYVTRNA